MTLLNTASSLGQHWIAPVSLYLIGLVSSKPCIKYLMYVFIRDNSELFQCYSLLEKTKCMGLSGTCIPQFEGYLFLTVLSTIFGYWYFNYMQPIINKLTV